MPASFTIGVNETFTIMAQPQGPAAPSVVIAWVCSDPDRLLLKVHDRGHACEITPLAPGVYTLTAAAQGTEFVDTITVTVPGEAGEVPTAEPPLPTLPVSWFAKQPPSLIHGPGHTARVMCWASLLARDTPWLDTVLWAAACHDLRRVDDGPDPEHGKRAGAWVRERLPYLVKHPPAELELIARACDWHVCPDAESPFRHEVLTILKDADPLDRARLGPNALDPRFLRSRLACELITEASSLCEHTRYAQTAAEVWRVALKGGMPIAPVLEWASRIEEKNPPAPPRVGACELLHRMADEPCMAALTKTQLGFSVRPDAQLPQLPIIEVFGVAQIRGEQLAWLRQQDWYAWPEPRMFRTYLAPLVPVEKPPYLYHSTPAANLDSILKRGLLPGERAGRNTTNNAGAWQFIYVSLWSQADAEMKLIQTAVDAGGQDPNQEWVQLKIDASRVGRLFRDPVSMVGAILEVQEVPPSALTVVRRWGPQGEKKVLTGLRPPGQGYPPGQGRPSGQCRPSALLLPEPPSRTLAALLDPLAGSELSILGALRRPSQGLRKGKKRR